MLTVPGATVINFPASSVDISGTIAPMEVDQVLNLSLNTLMSGSPILQVPIAISQKTDLAPKTVPTSQPRLTANGKRIGRPPGTFKVNKIVKKSQAEEAILPTPITCKWVNCYRQFNTIKDIAIHLNVVHFEARAVCRWEGCNNRRFKALYLLISHARSHTGERHLKCPMKDCIKAYKSRENLSTHVRTHTGEKPYECQFPTCVKKFTNASDRGKHENRCHSGKRDYICDVPNCTKAYTDPSSLRKHILHIHGPEVHESRKKTKVRWMYRRDGKQLNKDGTVTAIEKPILPIQEATQASIPVTNQFFVVNHFLGGNTSTVPANPVSASSVSVAFPGTFGLPSPLSGFFGFPSAIPGMGLFSGFNNTPANVAMQKTHVLPAPLPEAVHEGIIPEWNPSPRANVDFPYSAFTSVVPLLIKLNISVANFLTENEMNDLASAIIERQQFVRASYANLQKPLQIQEMKERPDCNCRYCKPGSHPV